MDLLKGLALLLLCQSAGEALARLGGVPLPGPVIGLVLCFAALAWAPLRTPIATAADGLLAHLSLLFVPVGVGVMTHFGLVAQYGMQMLAAIVGSTWIGLAVTALVLRALLKPAAA
jgi:holin-like protein